MYSAATITGTLLVGTFFNTFLYGLVTYQFAAYYHRKFNDGPVIKYMVFFLFGLDTAHSVIAMYMMWDYGVTNYNNPPALNVLEWPYGFTPIATGLAALTTHIFLGMRIWRMSGSKLLFGVVIIMATPTFILAIICSAETWILKYFSKLPRIRFLAVSWLATQTAVDIFITVTLIAIFSRFRTGIRRTDTVLNRLIRGSIQTGPFAAIFSLASLISYIVIPSTNIHAMFAIPIGRIYTNTLMDTLIAREFLREELFGGMDNTTGPIRSPDRLGTIRFVGRRHDNSIDPHSTGRPKVSAGDV